MSLGFIFLTGLTTGGISCLAMQGGLLASMIANRSKLQQGQEPQPTEKQTISLTKKVQLLLAPVGAFLFAKLFVHILFGFLLGWLGASVEMSLEVRITFQIFTAFFLMATALNLLDAHPALRVLSFEPPPWIRKMVRNTQHNTSLFGPAVLGALTIFIPCGVTQSMEVLAITSGSGGAGASILGTFVLGTMPVFAVLGAVTTQLTQKWESLFRVFAAITLGFLALSSINGVLVVINSPMSVNAILESARTRKESTGETDMKPMLTNGVQKITLQVTNAGYEPRRLAVVVGHPVELTIQSQDTYSCALAFVFKEFGITANLKATDSRTFTFTPQKTGRFPFACSMGMYTGMLEVKPERK